MDIIDYVIGHLPYILVGVLFLASIAWIVLWFKGRRARGARTYRAPRASTGLLSLGSTRSLLVGAIFSLFVGIMIAFTFGRWTGHPGNFTGRMVLGVVIATLYYAWGTGFWYGFMVPQTYRGVLLLFGSAKLGPDGKQLLDPDKKPIFNGKRISTGPEGKGLEEGPNWLPLGPPFFMVTPEEALEVKVEFKGCTVRTNDHVPFTVDGFIMVRKERPDVFRGVQDPYGSIMQLALQALRDDAKLMDSDAFGVADKEELSDKVEVELRRLQAKYNGGDDRRWGLYVVDLEISAIKPPEDIQKAWAEPAIQRHLGIAENFKADRRKEQAQKFKDMGVNPNTALAAAMVNAQEPGAKVSNVAFEGLEEVGKGLGVAGKGLGDGIGKIGEAIEAFVDKLPDRSSS